MISIGLLLYLLGWVLCNTFVLNVPYGSVLFMTSILMLVAGTALFVWEVLP